MLAAGTLYRLISGTGINPGGTGQDYVVASFSLPANSLDGISNRILQFSASGNLAANSNNKTMKLFFNCTTATVGSAVTGGTTIATTSVSTGSGVGWMLTATVAKYGAPNSNTQIYQETGTIVGTVHGGLGVAGAITATENAPILCAVTIFTLAGQGLGVPSHRAAVAGVLGIGRAVLGVLMESVAVHVGSF